MRERKNRDFLRVSMVSVLREKSAGFGLMKSQSRRATNCATPGYSVFIRLGVFSPKTAVQDGCRFPIRRGIRSFNAAHAAAVVPVCFVMLGAQVPLRFRLQGSSLFALPAAGAACVFRHAHRPVPCKSIPAQFVPE